MKSFLTIVAALLALPLSSSAATIKMTDGNLAYSEQTPWGLIDITFNKCMANELYTFSSVSIDGVEVNHTKSDNIGPFLVDQKGWSGGNHLNGERRSARTVSVDVMVDGHPIVNDTTIIGSVLTVEVVNQLLHPSDDSNLAVERMLYTVSGNSIDVEASHEFQCEAEMIERYYGMQSMFLNEYEILTPGGTFDQWTTFPVTSTGNELSFTKHDAGQFSTFIEHSKGGYQAAHMTRDGIGDRRFIRDDDIVFIGNSWSKSYHKLLGMHPVRRGDRINWHGIYSWFNTPIYDGTTSSDPADRTFDYAAYIAGRPYLFHVSASGVLTPSPL